MVAPYLIAVVMGAILSILFRKPYIRLCKLKNSPKLFALLVTALIGLLVVLPVLWFGYMAVRQASEVAGSMAGVSLESVAKKLTQWKFTQTLVGDASAVEQQIREGLKRVASVAPGALLKIFGGLPEMVLQLVLGLISCYFSVLQIWPAMAERFQLLASSSGVSPITSSTP